MFLYKGQSLFEVRLSDLIVQDLEYLGKKLKGRLKVSFIYNNCYLCSLEDTGFFSLSPIHTYTHILLQNYLVTWLHLKYQKKSNSHLYLFSVSCSAGHSRIEYKVPDISAEEEKNGK